MGDRAYDLILLGATGFTGRLVAEYLARRVAGTPLRWALAGRSQSKLEAVRRDLVAIDPATAQLPLVIVDAMDPTATAALARTTTVVCTTVGPYQRYGAALVAGCADAGTAYCDLTGEVPFVRASIDAHHERAIATGARILHCCGFDSVPSDLGVWLLQRELTARTGRGAPSVLAGFQLRGAASGGTIASMLELSEAARRDRAVRKLLLDPYALDPAGTPRGDDRDRHGVRYEAELGAYTAPFVMAAVNARVVRRSHALRGQPWGRAWRYDEVMVTGPGVRGVAGAAAITGALAGFFGALQVGPLRALLEKRLPKPGDGPSPEQRRRGRYRTRLVGTVDGVRAEATFADSLDPGYDGTAKLLGEAALALALDPPLGGGGVLTPSVALGDHLLPRLRAAGVTLDVAIG